MLRDPLGIDAQSVAASHSTVLNCCWIIKHLDCNQQNRLQAGSKGIL